MATRVFCLAIVCTAILYVPALCLAADKLNVLLITADDLGVQLSCYGDPIANTPEMDELAKSGVRFKTAYVAQASCSPSRSAMFTGMYPHGNGHYGLANANVGFRVHEHLIDHLVPNVLKRAGYRTGIIGKLHVDPEDEFAFDFRSREGFGQRDVRLQTDLAREFIGDGRQTPWFLMFNVFDPHVARASLPGGKRGPQYLPDVVKGIPAVDNVLTADQVRPWPWQQIDSAQQRTKIAGYYNCVHRVDAAIGMLMSVLDKSSSTDNTLVILLGDHGPPFTRGKTSCYEAGLRVPFLVRWPEVSSPHVSDRLVSSVDIYPTILDAANIARPDHVHGRSLRSVLNSAGEAVRWRDTLVGEFHYHGATPFFPRRAITDGRYKLIHNMRATDAQASPRVDGDTAFEQSQKLAADHPARLAMQRLANPPEWELYDLSDDPIEFQNRSGEPAFAAAETRLKRSLARWQEETSDPFRDPVFRRATQARYVPR